MINSWHKPCFTEFRLTHISIHLHGRRKMSRAVAEQSRFSTDYQFAAAHSGVLGNERPVINDRAAMHRRLNECCSQNPTLVQELMAHPRAIYAIAVEECFGVHRSLFFVQIQHVEVIHEDEQTLGIVLTACHLACVAPRLEVEDQSSTSACHICSHGNQVCQQSIVIPSNKAATRESVRNWIQDRAKVDDQFRQKLISSPSSTWSEILQELLLPTNHPLNQIQAIQLFVETAETIGFVLEFNTFIGSIIPG